MDNSKRTMWTEIFWDEVEVTGIHIKKMS